MTLKTEDALAVYPLVPAGTHPALLSPDYRSTVLRSPSKPLVVLPQRIGELTGPVFGAERLAAGDDDLTTVRAPSGGTGEAIGQRIVVSGRVLDSDGRPVPDTLVEVWQANAAGRYAHIVDNWPAPLDPNFTGTGRTMTDSDGNYSFTTIKPGAYPWGNHYNAWRPAHIHFSLFGTAFTQRLVTQMYFPDDPLFFQDPIYNSVPEAARHRMVSRFSLDHTRDNFSLGFLFDIVLRGHEATPFEDSDHDEDEA